VTEQSAEIERIATALRELSDELIERVRSGCPDGSAAYACGAVDALADRLDDLCNPTGQPTPTRDEGTDR
jgi:hypothetical protein